MIISILGGLAEEVTEKDLHATFIPFGDIIDIQIPLDYETGNVTINSPINYLYSNYLYAVIIS